MQKLAEKLDHRKVGKEQQLFMFSTYSPGSAFFLPHGTRIYNKLMEFIRDIYRQRGYEEVQTPLLYSKELWKISGHWENYKDDMYVVTGGGDSAEAANAVTQESGDGMRECCGSEDEDHGFGLKPMNCPGHCLIFKSQTRSYRDLPIRYADFSSLHRNESSGSLSGLTRVRRFNQDDAHIFCAQSQLKSEISQCLEFINDVYGVLGFESKLKLSTRPEKFIGEEETWDHAEAVLRECLSETGRPFELNEGDGAFYGPKIDVVLTDALKREHQCGTIQLDFQLPRRFELAFTGQDGESHTPVMVHRAVLGSLERMIAVLIEHYAGKWPLWLSPRQVIVCPISSDHHAYAEQVAKQLRDSGLFVDVGSGGTSINKQIRRAQLAQYNYILVTGDAEREGATVNVRSRDGTVHGESSVDEFARKLGEEIASFEISPSPASPPQSKGP